MLARHFSPNAIRLRRLDQRDDAIRALAMQYDALSGRKIAEAVHRDLLRYAVSAPPADAKRAALHQILDLIGGGKIPSAGQIRGILAGVRS
jgi:hypothetical protein